MGEEEVTTTTSNQDEPIDEEVHEEVVGAEEVVSEETVQEETVEGWLFFFDLLIFGCLKKFKILMVDKYGLP